MSNKKKGQLTGATERAKHLRKYLRRKFWKGERKAGKKLINSEKMTDQLGRDIASAWMEASKELGVKIKAPFRLQLDGDNSIECILLVEDFGSNLGTMVFIESDWLGNKQIESSGYGISTLGESYQKYDRDSFIEMLNDWGYFGDEIKKPEWYTGEPWSK